jgi:WD40 repeat protein
MSWRASLLSWMNGEVNKELLLEVGASRSKSQLELIATLSYDGCRSSSSDHSNAQDQLHMIDHIFIMLILFVRPIMMISVQKRPLFFPSPTPSMSGQLRQDDKKIQMQRSSSADPEKFYSKRSGDQFANARLRDAPSRPRKPSAQGDRFITVRHTQNMMLDYPTPGRTPKKQKLVFTTPSPQKQLSTSQIEINRLNRILNTPTKSDAYPLATYSESLQHQSPPKPRRAIDTAPYLVLDAPNTRDDYYINVLDWSSKGQLAVGLGNLVYTWSNDSAVTNVFTCQADDYVTTCSFSKDASKCAVTTDAGDIIIFPAETSAATPLFKTHEIEGASTFQWTTSTGFYTGDHFGKITSFDMRSKQTTSFNAHADRIVGFAVSNDGIQLASGCNGHVY